MCCVLSIIVSCVIEVIRSQHRSVRLRRVECKRLVVSREARADQDAPHAHTHLQASRFGFGRGVIRVRRSNGPHIRPRIGCIVWSVVDGGWMRRSTCWTSATVASQHTLPTCTRYGVGSVPISHAAHANYTVTSVSCRRVCVSLYRSTCPPVTSW